MGTRSSVKPGDRRHLQVIHEPPSPLSTVEENRMEKLEALSSIARLSGNVVRVLGQNPGKFTLQGTNTYIIGRQNPYTLIDTGEGREEYIPVLESALRETAKFTNADEPAISDIIISHWHHDHVGGLPGVLALLRRLWEERKPRVLYKPPRLHKFPIPQNSPTTAHSSHNLLPSIIDSLPLDLYTPSPDGSIFHHLHDYQVLSPSGLRILHTPGHTVDSICLHIPQDRALYTADNVLGQGTAVFEDLATYLASLKKMADFGHSADPATSETDGYEMLYPGHGPIVANGRDLIGTYIKHRLEREAQILKLIQSPPVATTTATESSPTSWTTWKVVSMLYAAYPQNLWLPAAHGVDLHLKKLEGEGIVKRVGGEGKDTEWQHV